MEKINIKNDFSLRGITDNDYVLQRNGIDMVCPEVPPVMMKQKVASAVGQPPQEQVVSTRTSCSTMCPKFELVNDEKNVLSARTVCGCVAVVRNISKVVSVVDAMEANKNPMKAVN